MPSPRSEYPTVSHGPLAQPSSRERASAFFIGLRFMHFKSTRASNLSEDPSSRFVPSWLLPLPPFVIACHTLHGNSGVLVTQTPPTPPTLFVRLFARAAAAAAGIAAAGGAGKFAYTMKQSLLQEGRARSEGGEGLKESTSDKSEGARRRPLARRCNAKLCCG